MSPERLSWLRANANNCLGKRRSKEHSRKISEALTGRPLSEEHRLKVAAINADPELSKRKSESRKARRKPAETHRQMHKRLVCDRGSARNHLCVDCQMPASAWTYNWSTWEDVAQDIGRKRLTFSTNPDAYEPRCDGCHNRLDRNPAPWDAPGSRRGAKLTESDVEWIRTNGLGLSATAAHLKIDQGTVWRIRKGLAWKAVP